MKMKNALTFVLSVALSVSTLGGCGAQVSSPKGTLSAEPDTSATKTALKVAVAQDLDESLDPHKSVSAGTKEIMFNVFEGLVKPTPSGDLMPAVAESYIAAQDGLSYTFSLRPGVKFHNGREVTAQDVIYSVSRCAKGENGVLKIAALEDIASLSAEGNDITMELNKPNPEFLSCLTLAILPYDYEDQDTFPVGTGPFRFVSRSAQENIILSRFEDYWGEKPAISDVTIKIIENADTLLMSLSSGAVDLCAHLTSTQVAQIGDAYHVEEGTMNLVQAMYLNNAVKPFDDVRVRQALSYAVNKRDIIDLAFDGYGTPIGSSMYPAFEKYYLPSLADAYEYNPEKAKQLLAEAGYPDGFDMTITVPGNYQPHVDTAEVLAEQLKGVGIRAKINLVEWGNWLSDVYVGRKFEATVVGVDASEMTARALLQRFVSDEDTNFINYHDPVYDEIFTSAVQSYDDAERTELYKKAEMRLSENAANVYIQDLADLVAVKNGLTGLRFYPMYILDLSALKWNV